MFFISVTQGSTSLVVIGESTLKGYKGFGKVFCSIGQGLARVGRNCGMWFIRMSAIKSCGMLWHMLSRVHVGGATGQPQ